MFFTCGDVVRLGGWDLHMGAPSHNGFGASATHNDRVVSIIFLLQKV